MITSKPHTEKIYMTPCIDLIGQRKIYRIVSYHPTKKKYVQHCYACLVLLLVKYNNNQVTNFKCSIRLKV
jgi:GTPase SAR1 family protein